MKMNRFTLGIGAFGLRIFDAEGTIQLLYHLVSEAILSRHNSKTLKIHQNRLRCPASYLPNKCHPQQKHLIPSHFGMTISLVLRDAGLSSWLHGFPHLAIFVLLATTCYFQAFDNFFSTLAPQFMSSRSSIFTDNPQG